jgi:transcriptional regulator with XRE-family HTH domain
MATSNTVEINGFLIRELRKRDHITVVELAERVGIQRPYMVKIETGRNRRVSFKVFNALIAAFAIEDHRALLSKPYGDDVADLGATG